MEDYEREALWEAKADIGKIADGLESVRDHMPSFFDRLVVAGIASGKSPCAAIDQAEVVIALLARRAVERAQKKAENMAPKP